MFWGCGRPLPRKKQLLCYHLPHASGLSRRAQNAAHPPILAVSIGSLCYRSCSILQSHVAIIAQRRRLSIPRRLEAESEDEIYPARPTSRSVTSLRKSNRASAASGHHRSSPAVESDTAEKPMRHGRETHATRLRINTVSRPDYRDDTGVLWRRSRPDRREPDARARPHGSAGAACGGRSCVGMRLTHMGYRSRSMEADDGPDAAVVVPCSTAQCGVLLLR
jgi:hypothetical protein